MNNTYRSKDFYLCAFLEGMGHSPRVEMNGRVAMFVFDNSPSLQEHVRQFYASEKSLSPVRYSQSIKTMKSMLYLHLDGNEQYVPQLIPTN